MLGGDPAGSAPVRTLLLCLAVTAAAAAAPTLSAQSSAMEAMATRIFERMDLDADGRVTEGEYRRTRGSYGAAFRTVDLDGNGSLTLEEYLRAIRRHHAPAPEGRSV